MAAHSSRMSPPIPQRTGSPGFGYRSPGRDSPRALGYRGMHAGSLSPPVRLAPPPPMPVPAASAAAATLSDTDRLLAQLRAARAQFPTSPLKQYVPPTQLPTSPLKQYVPPTLAATRPLSPMLVRPSTLPPAQLQSPLPLTATAAAGVRVERIDQVLAEIRRAQCDIARRPETAPPPQLLPEPRQRTVTPHEKADAGSDLPVQSSVQRQTPQPLCAPNTSEPLAEPISIPRQPSPVSEAFATPTSVQRQQSPRTGASVTHTSPQQSPVAQSRSLRRVGMEMESAAEVGRLEDRLRETEQATFDLMAQRDAAQLQVVELQRRLADAEDEMRSMQEVSITAAERRVQRSKAEAAAARFDADDARRMACDQVAGKVDQRLLGLHIRTPESKVDTIADAFRIDSARKKRREWMLDRARAAAERGAMAAHDSDAVRVAGSGANHLLMRVLWTLLFAVAGAGVALLLFRPQVPDNVCTVAQPQ
eukprot:TRINITY_DN1358_c4_g1_i1.p1 TRINITY_DN1358_c4_g1~~TRINITY_DN1358_c4_g1_i1.p1  ORF type:complete len:477 (+),score=50.83 TRINITY_DN1358_c4_g1_i1:61-1491(+)